MSSLIRRAISRLLSKNRPVEEEIRYVDFFEPVKTPVQDPTPDKAPEKDVSLNAPELELLALELTPFQAALEIEISAAAAQDNTAETSCLEVIHPDDDWFVPEPFDAPSSLLPTEEPPQTATVDGSDSTTMPSDERSTMITDGAVLFVAETQVAAGQPVRVATEQATSPSPTVPYTLGNPDTSAFGTWHEPVPSYSPEADADILDGLSKDIDELKPDLEQVFAFIAGATVPTDDGETDWLLDEELVAEIAELQGVPFEDLPDWPDEAYELKVLEVAPVEEEIDENLSWRAGAHAASLVNQLEFTREAERSQALRWLKELLVEFPYGSSHAAIARVVYAGTTFHQLIEAASIIRWWRSDPSLWLIRRYDRLQRQWVVSIDHLHGRSALSWRCAAALSANFDAIEALALLTGELRDCWIRLTPDSLGAGAFATYVASNISSLGHLGFVHGHDKYAEPDAYNWLSELEPTKARAIAPDGRLAYHAALPAPREFPKIPKGKDADAPK